MKNKIIFSIDPGKTSGFALFHGGELKTSGWFRHSPETVKKFTEALLDFEVDELVMESFRLYPWKAKNQFWSDFLTTEIIGVFKQFAWEHGIPVYMQPASNKQPFPDERLRKMDMYVPNNHARDAVRHALYRIRFGKD